MENAIDLGSKSGNFIYADIQDTNGFTDRFGLLTNEVFYKFTLTTPMDITISHCGSDVEDTYMHLMRSANQIVAFNDNHQNIEACSNLSQAYLELKNLAAGTYYVISEGNNTNGNITTTIKGVIPPVNIAGDLMNNPIELGSHSSGFVYSNTQNTDEYTNQYQGQATKDVFYRFTLETLMDITISHCGSGLSDTYVHLLDASGAQIVFNNDYSGEGACSNTRQAYLKVQNLAAGTYYVVSEGYNENGSITTRIEGIIPPVDAIGDHLNNPIDLGNYSSGFTCSDTQNTDGFTNQYQGRTTKDVFYKFALQTPMDITISHCGSDVANTYVYLLNGSGEQITYSDHSTSESGCGNPTQAYLKINNLATGIYYIVSEGYNDNGNITTIVEGTIPVPTGLTGDSMGNPINLGSYPSDFIYLDTQDTNAFTNQYQGQTTNDVFYRFTTENPMDITISHCGSEVADTYVYLLRSSGEVVDFNDNYHTIGVCSNVLQAYLKVRNLQPGTYYVVSEGKYNNGSIFTQIEGEKRIASNVSSNQNYIRTIAPTISTPTVEGLAPSNALKTIQYFDGLGRPLQTVQANITPDKSDLVTYHEYDAYGRETNVWLPSVATSNNGAFVSFGNIGGKALATYNGDMAPYTKTVYENSPLNRILEQYGPGQDWHNQGKAVRTAYLLNNNTYSCKLFTTSDNKLEVSITRSADAPNYADNELFVTRGTDEDGNISYEFKDKLGQTVLTRQMEGTEAHDTYYVYDSYGNLRAVLPPLAADALDMDTWRESDLEQYTYLYKYDSRNRQIAKKLPGAGWVYYVYDNADQLIFSQDSEQRARGEWSFNIPDALGRTVLTGTCTNNLNYTQQLSSVVRANWANTTTQYKGYSIDPDILELVNARLLTVNFYDSYEFMGKNDIPAGNHSDYKYDGLQGYAGRYPDSFKGLNTGTLTALLDESENPTFTLSVMYYDYRGRPAQINSGQRLTKEYYCYTFGGQVKHKKVMHAKSDKAPTLFDHYTYTYDHAQRLVKTEHRITHHSTTSDWITLAEYTYDDLGRLKEKDLHGVNPVTYDYNIRSWTTGTASNSFTEALYYQNGYGIPSYNGNISSTIWQVGTDNYVRGYKFTYDGLNRLTAANYGEGATLSVNPDRFTEKVTRYDKHGNIKALQRYGKTAAAFGLIDDLAFGYSGNRMTFVNDAIQASDVDQSFHFNDRSSNSTGNEFEYDGNGNLVKDNNKNITGIQYNILNLPKRVLLSGGGSATYIYDASGVKYKVIYQGGGENKDTEYSSNVIYENGELDKVFTEEGYITFNGSIPTYHYYLTDHLGNNRVVMDQDGTIEQVNHYYPFGGLFDQTAEGLQAYKYNGKELDRTYGLDLYDYSARYMDGALGRFTTMDPLSEKYYAISPYAYCANNPVRFVDPTGMDWYSYMNKEGIMQYQWNAEIKSQKDLDKIMTGATHLGLTHKTNSTYYSLLGDKHNMENIDTKIIQKVDEALINFYNELSSINREQKGTSEDIRHSKETNFDIGLYKNGDHIVYEFEYKEATIYYQRIDQDIENKGKFREWGDDNYYRSNSNHGFGYKMKDGYPIDFIRTKGAAKDGSRYPEAIKMVFPTPKAKNTYYNNVRKAIYGKK